MDLVTIVCCPSSADKRLARRRVSYDGDYENITELTELELYDSIMKNGGKMRLNEIYG